MGSNHGRWVVSSHPGLAASIQNKHVISIYYMQIAGVGSGSDHPLIWYADC